VHAAVFVSFDDFEDFGGAADVDDALGDGEQHAEGRFVVETFADHAAITGFKNVQGEWFAGEKDDVKREEWNAVGRHRRQGLMITKARWGGERRLLGSGKRRGGGDKQAVNEVAAGEARSHGFKGFE